MSLMSDPNQSIGTIQQGTMSVGPAQTLNPDYAAEQKAVAAAASNGNRVIANQSTGTLGEPTMIVGTAPRPLTAANQSTGTPGESTMIVGTAPRPLTAANQSTGTEQAAMGSIVQAQGHTMSVGPEEKLAAAQAADAQRVVVPTAEEKAVAAAPRVVTTQSIGTAQESTPQDAAKAAFAGSFTVCPPGMTDTRDGYCQPPIIPFLTSSGAVSGECPPNTTLVADKGCLPAKIISWAPGAILIPYLSQLSTNLYNINTAINNTTQSSSPIALAINNAATKNLTGITSLSTSINTINESLRASQPATSYGGRRTRKKRGRRGNRKTKNIAK
jgi:hypothetical protein